jgi:outer membrane protease
MIVIDDEGIATFSSEYDEDAAWEAVDNAEDEDDSSDGTDTNSNFANASTVNTSEISA